MAREVAHSPWVRGVAAASAAAAASGSGAHVAPAEGTCQCPLGGREGTSPPVSNQDGEPTRPPWFEISSHPTHPPVAELLSLFASSRKHSLTHDNGPVPFQRRRESTGPRVCRYTAVHLLLHGTTQLPVPGLTLLPPGLSSSTLGRPCSVRTVCTDYLE